MTKRPISKSRTAVRALIFVLIAALGIGLISPMLVANNDWDKRHVHGFFLEPEDSLDVVLIGASQLYTGYSAPLAWQQYGYTSYPLTVSNIPARLYGSLLTEAVDRQHPKLIVVDIDGFINDENPETLEANLRKWIDNIPWSRNRLETIRTCVPRELQTSFYFNIAKYHANWYQVGKWVPVQRRLHIMDETGCSLTKGVETVCKSLSADFEPDVRPLTLSAANEQICARSARRRRVSACRRSFCARRTARRRPTPASLTTWPPSWANTATTCSTCTTRLTPSVLTAARILSTPTTSTPPAWRSSPRGSGSISPRIMT